MAFWFYRGCAGGSPPPLPEDGRRLGARPAEPAGVPLLAPHRRSSSTGSVAECPGGALSREQRELLVDIGRCTGCGRCVEIGDGAVQPSGEFELATSDRRALVKRVPIRGDREEHVGG